LNKNSEDFYLIFEDGDPVRTEVVRAVLEAGGIDCFIQNAGVQNLFALGSIGGLNPLMGTVKVYVRHEDRARAEALLTDLRTMPESESGPGPYGELPPGAVSETPKPAGKGFLSLLRRWLMK